MKKNTNTPANVVINRPAHHNLKGIFRSVYSDPAQVFGYDYYMADR